MAEIAGKSSGRAGRITSEKLLAGRVIAAAGMNHQILAPFDVKIDRVEQSVGDERFGAVREVVLVAQLARKILERNLQVFDFEREERAPARLGREVLEHLIPVGFDLAQVCGNGVDNGVRLEVLDDGEKGVDFIARIDSDNSVPRPDLLLLDLNLPKWSGKDVLERVRNSPA